LLSLWLSQLPPLSLLWALRYLLNIWLETGGKPTHAAPASLPPTLLLLLPVCSGVAGTASTLAAAAAPVVLLLAPPVLMLECPLTYCARLSTSLTSVLGAAERLTACRPAPAVLTLSELAAVGLLDTSCENLPDRRLLLLLLCLVRTLRPSFMAR